MGSHTERLGVGCDPPDKRSVARRRRSRRLLVDYYKDTKKFNPEIGVKLLFPPILGPNRTSHLYHRIEED